MRNKHCEGCNNTCDVQIIPNTNNNGSCPCTICVVKMVCETTCDEWLEWLHTYDNVLKREKMIIK